jgi:hypothetical protein
MSDWISKQHDGAISPDCVRNFVTFGRFLKYIVYNLESTIELMRSVKINEMENSTHREKCVDMLEQMITQALKDAGASKFGLARWMAHVSISDMEEFVVDPFGTVHTLSVPEGKYSREGLDMVNRALKTRLTYVECLDRIVLYINANTPMEHLRVLGYDKVDNVVLNVVNKRPFSGVDAEHFLCKAWIIARLTFGNSQLSSYPNQCSAHTHPSRVLHEMADDEISNHMQGIERAYTSCMEGDVATIILPELCKLSGENHVNVIRKEGEGCANIQKDREEHIEI